MSPSPMWATRAGLESPPPSKGEINVDPLGLEIEQIEPGMRSHQPRAQVAIRPPRTVAKLMAQVLLHCVLPASKSMVAEVGPWFPWVPSVRREQHGPGSLSVPCILPGAKIPPCNPEFRSRGSYGCLVADRRVRHVLLELWHRG